MLEDPAVESAAGFIGGGRGTNNAQTFVRPRSRSASARISAQLVVERIRQNMPMVPGANMWLNVEQDIRFGGGGGGGQGQFQYCCWPTTCAAATWGTKVRDALRDLPELTGISDELVSSQAVTLTVDRAAARPLGVEMSAVTQALNNAFGQRQVSTIYNALNQYRVVMEVAPEFATRARKRPIASS